MSAGQSPTSSCLITDSQSGEQAVIFFAYYAPCVGWVGGRKGKYHSPHIYIQLCVFCCNPQLKIQSPSERS